MKFEQWNGFKDGDWTNTIDVREFIQKNAKYVKNLDI